MVWFACDGLACGGFGFVFAGHCCKGQANLALTMKLHAFGSKHGHKAKHKHK
jgi:hypothetical protein